MPLCGRPACVVAASSVVSVRKLTAVAALPIAVWIVCAPARLSRSSDERLPAAVDDRDRDGVAVLLAARERRLRGLLRGGGRECR